MKKQAPTPPDAGGEDADAAGKTEPAKEDADAAGKEEPAKEDADAAGKKEPAKKDGADAGKEADAGGEGTDGDDGQQLKYDRNKAQWCVTKAGCLKSDAAHPLDANSAGSEVQVVALSDFNGRFEGKGFPKASKAEPKRTHSKALRVVGSTTVRLREVLPLRRPEQKKQ